MKVTPEERAAAIDFIVDKGLTHPTPTWVLLRDMYRTLGGRVIFMEAIPGTLAALAFAVFYIMLIIVQISLPAHAQSLHASFFLLSPTVFIGLTLSTEAIERMSGMYELKMVCKYTLRQITSFRILCFSLVGTVFVVAGCSIVYALMDSVYLIQLISLSLSSLFLCSLLIIHLMRRLRSGWYLGTVIWTIAGILPFFLFGQAWDDFLTHLPPVLTLSVAAIAFVLFLWGIKNTIKNNNEVFNYAYR
ncbi:MAG: hypothetical protein LBD23_18350 [Oscillospiraceae bacterium]|jgi:hypothetical protein|nr:hypothetical protein [Oscillospiraceae bacterium]